MGTGTMGPGRSSSSTPGALSRYGALVSGGETLLDTHWLSVSSQLLRHTLHTGDRRWQALKKKMRCGHCTRGDACCGCVVTGGCKTSQGGSEPPCAQVGQAGQLQ